MKITWKLAPKPETNELLSSFLVRVAHSHGVGAYHFYSYHLPKTKIWSRDIDRNVSDGVLNKIVEMSGLPFEVVYGMTLKPFVSRLMSEHNFLKNKNAMAISPWISSVGIYHTTRRRFGLQYCPECLAIDPSFKNLWRLSFVAICPVHRVALLDACHCCDSPVAPHRNHISHLNCHVCQRSLAKGRSLVLEPGAIEKLSLFCEIFANTSTQKNPVSIDAAQLFIGMHILLSILRKHASHCRNSYLLNDAGNGPIELLRNHERAPVIAFLHRLLTEWPIFFRSLALQTGLTQHHVAHRPMPDWIQSEMDLLPIGKSIVRKTKNVPLVNQLKSIQRQKPEGWRATRAALLLKMAKAKP